jgi:hypothetical protein
MDGALLFIGGHSVATRPVLHSFLFGRLLGIWGPLDLANGILEEAFVMFATFTDAIVDPSIS